MKGAVFANSRWVRTLVIMSLTVVASGGGIPATGREARLPIRDAGLRMNIQQFSLLLSWRQFDSTKMSNSCSCRRTSASCALYAASKDMLESLVVVNSTMVGVDMSSPIRRT